jgi:hypothetical protein
MDKMAMNRGLLVQTNHGGCDHGDVLVVCVCPTLVLNGTSHRRQPLLKGLPKRHHVGTGVEVRATLVFSIVSKLPNHSQLLHNRLACVHTIVCDQF